MHFIFMNPFNGSKSRFRIMISLEFFKFTQALTFKHLSYISLLFYCLKYRTILDYFDTDQTGF